MSRTLTGAHTTNYTSNSVREIIFVYLDFSSGIVRVHNAAGTYTWGGQSWLGVGDFGGVSVLEEGVEVRPMKIKLTLSGIDSSLMSTAMTEEYHGRDVRVYRGTLDADNQLAADPDLIWSGFIDNMAVSLAQGTGVIEVVCENRLARFDRPNVQRYTIEDHQERFSGDLFFEYLPQMADGYEVEWGGEVVNSRTTSRVTGGPRDNPVLTERVP